MREVKHICILIKGNESVISDFHREVDVNYVLLGYYAASSGNSLQSDIYQMS